MSSVVKKFKIDDDYHVTNTSRIDIRNFLGYVKDITKRVSDEDLSDVHNKFSEFLSHFDISLEVLFELKEEMDDDKYGDEYLSNLVPLGN